MMIPLSPLDYYFLRKHLYSIQFIFEFKNRINEQPFREALLKTLHLFPALRSRLEIQSGEAALRVFDILTTDDLPLRAQSTDPVITAPGQPLLKMVLGQTNAKSYLSVSLSHLVGDGYSLFRFLAALSDVFHHRVISPPSNDRSVLSGNLATPRLVESPRLFEDTGYVRPNPPDPLSSRHERIHFSRSQIEQLKHEANAEKLGLTTNHILMADLLRRFHQDIPLYNGKLIVRCPVDYRNIHLGINELESDYFGNAVRDAVATFDPQSFSDLSLADISIKIRDAIQAIDREQSL